MSLVKKDAIVKIENFKARYVAKGFRQMEKINYFDTFSQVISLSLVTFFVVTLDVLRIGFVKTWISKKHICMLN